MLKQSYEKQEEIPESARDLYSQKDGKFVIAIEGMVSKDKLDEFRTSNIDLKKQIETLTERFDGIDPDEARKLSDKALKERDKKLIDAGKVDDIVNERVTAAKTGFDKELKKTAEENRKLQIQLEGLLIDNAVRDAATKSGVKAGAVDDVLLRARQVFKVVDGQAMAFDGEKQIYGKTGDPISVAEYISDKLATTAPHLFEASTGGGARKAETASTGSSGKVGRDDEKGFLANVADIASGKKQVA